MEVHSEDPSGFVLSSSITAPFNVPPTRFIFFSPIGGCHDNIEQFPWRKAEPEPLCHYIHWHDSVVGEKKRTILTPYLVGWNNRISHIWCFFERASEGVVVVVGWGRNAPWHTREQLRYKRCS